MRDELINLRDKHGETIIVDCNIIPSLELKPQTNRDFKAAK